MKKKIPLIVMILLALSQFAAVIYFNYAQAEGNLNFDSALALRHGLEMWENGIFLKNFVYFSTLETDCIGFFAAGLYKLLGDFKLSMALTHGFFYLLTAGIFYDITKQLRATKEQFLLILMLYFTPYAVNMLDWVDMLHTSVAQYSFRVLSLLLTLDVMLMFDCKEKNKFKICLAILFSAAVNFWTSLSSGNFVLCMVLIPLALAYVINCCRNLIPFYKDLRTYVLLFHALISYAGYFLRSEFVGASSRNDLYLVTAEKLPANINMVLTGVLELFGGVITDPDISIFSDIGISALLRFAFIFICLAAALRKLWLDKLQSTFSYYLITTILVNLGILLITVSPYGEGIFAHRYHILWCVMLLIGAGLALADKAFWGEDERHLMPALTIIMILVIFINVTGFQKLDAIDENNENKAAEKAMIETAKEYNANSILIYDEYHASPVICVLEPEMYSVYVNYYDGKIDMKSFDYYTNYTESINIGANILVCTEEQYLSMPEYMRCAYKLVDSETLGNALCMYYSDYSAWDGMSGLPLHYVTESVDYPYSPGYQSLETFDSFGRLYVNAGTGGHVLWGPYTRAVGGTYNITIEYEVVQPSNQCSIFELCADNKVLMRIELPNDQTSFVIENVQLSGNSLMEFRFWKPNDSIFAIESISFLRTAVN